jgi:hypothetical protein
MVCELMPWSAGLTRNIAQCLEDYDIPVRYNCTVVGIHGKKRLKSVTIARVDGPDRIPVPGTEEEITCDTLLLAVGLIPENELSRSASVTLGEKTGGPVVDQTMATSVPGIFACGNCVHVHDLADYVTLEGRRAGHGAARYVLDRCTHTQPVNTGQILLKPGPGVRYCIPHFIRPFTSPAGNDNDDEIVVYFRADRPYRPASVTVTADGRIMMTRQETVVTPGEMQALVLRGRDLRDVAAVTVSITGEGEAEDKP